MCSTVFCYLTAASSVSSQSVRTDPSAAAGSVGPIGTLWNTNITLTARQEIEVCFVHFLLLFGLYLSLHMSSTFITRVTEASGWVQDYLWTCMLVCVSPAPCVTVSTFLSCWHRICRGRKSWFLQGDVLPAGLNSDHVTGVTWRPHRHWQQKSCEGIQEKNTRT